MSLARRHSNCNIQMLCVEPSLVPLRASNSNIRCTPVSFTNWSEQPRLSCSPRGSARLAVAMTRSACQKLRRTFADRAFVCLAVNFNVRNFCVASSVVSLHQQDKPGDWQFTIH